MICFSVRTLSVTGEQTTYPAYFQVDNPTSLENVESKVCWLICV